MTLIRSLQNESGNGAARAEIHQDSDGVFEVHYYSLGTSPTPIVERYENHSIHYAESAAINWLEGVKSLNG